MGGGGGGGLTPCNPTPSISIILSDGRFNVSRTNCKAHFQSSITAPVYQQDLQLYGIYPSQQDLLINRVDGLKHTKTLHRAPLNPIFFDEFWD